MNKWRLFAPPEDWQHPIEIEEAALPLLTALAERLGLRVGRDDTQQKFFLGAPAVAKPGASSGGEGVTYPSGLWIPKAVLSEARRLPRQPPRGSVWHDRGLHGRAAAGGQAYR